MPTQLTLAQMKEFVRNHFEHFVTRQNAAVIRTNMAPDFRDHDGPHGMPTDVAGDENMMFGMYKAMPGLKVTIEDMVAEGDKVVCRNIWRWTITANILAADFFRRSSNNAEGFLAFSSTQAVETVSECL